MTYQVLTLTSWLLLVVAGAYYTFNAPDDCHKHCHKIWKQNKENPTPFALNSVVTSIYWYTLPPQILPYELL